MTAMQSIPQGDADRRLMWALEQYRRRVAEAERQLREEVDAYSAEIIRQEAAEPAPMCKETVSWAQ